MKIYILAAIILSFATNVHAGDEINNGRVGEVSRILITKERHGAVELTARIGQNSRIVVSHRHRFQIIKHFDFLGLDGVIFLGKKVGQPPAIYYRDFVDNSLDVVKQITDDQDTKIQMTTHSTMHLWTIDTPSESTILWGVGGWQFKELDRLDPGMETTKLEIHRPFLFWERQDAQGHQLRVYQSSGNHLLKETRLCSSGTFASQYRLLIHQEPTGQTCRTWISDLLSGTTQELSLGDIGTPYDIDFNLEFALFYHAGRNETSVVNIQQHTIEMTFQGEPIGFQATNSVSIWVRNGSDLMEYRRQDQHLITTQTQLHRAAVFFELDYFQFFASSDWNSSTQELALSSYKMAGGQSHEFQITCEGEPTVQASREWPTLVVSQCVPGRVFHLDLSKSHPRIETTGTQFLDFTLGAYFH